MMAIFDEFDGMKRQPKTTKTPAMNVPIRVTGYHFSQNGDPTQDRIYGIRIDTKEKIEAYVYQTNQPNQPSISDLQHNVSIGGSALLSGSFMDRKSSKINSESSYVMSCRWPVMLTPQQGNGKAFVAMARVGVPFVHEDGRVNHSVDILSEAKKISSMEEFDQHFFDAISPDKSVFNAFPYAGVRITEIDGNNEPGRASMMMFRAEFRQDGQFGPGPREASVQLYSGGHPEATERFNKTKEIVSQALNDPSLLVEIVQSRRFSAGIKTKQDTAKKLTNNLPEATWRMIPARLPTVDESGEVRENRMQTGYTEMTVCLRPVRTGGGLVCSVASPLTDHPVVTTAGIATKHDREMHSRLHAGNTQPDQTTNQNQLSEDLGQGVQGQPVPSSHNYEQRKQIQPAAAAPNGQRQRTVPANEYQDLSSASKIAEPSSFRVQAAGGQYFAVIPPSVDTEMENSILRNLSTIAAPRVQNGHWMFPNAAYEQVRTTLGMSVDIISSSNPMYSKTIEDTVTAQHSDAGQNTSTTPQGAVDLDLGALGKEVDEKFGTTTPGIRR